MLGYREDCCVHVADGYAGLADARGGGFAGIGSDGDRQFVRDLLVAGEVE